MTKLPLPPEQLINTNGKANLGVYNGPILDINLNDFDYRILGQFPYTLSAGLAKKQIKRWQYQGVVDKDLVIGVAVIDLSYVGSAFAYVYDRKTQTQKEINLVDPGGRNTTYSKSSVAGFSALQTRKAQIRLDNGEGESLRRIDVTAPDFQIHVEIEDDPKKFQSISACTRNGLHGFNYTHKAAGFPAKGTVIVDGVERALSDDALAVLDWTAGCAKRETFWNWANGAGRLEDGTAVGINLVSGINESAYTENVLWIDGKPEKVDIIHFDYDTKDFSKPWAIRSNDGKVDLTFTPEGERMENQNLLLVVSKFRQPFGNFKGSLTIDGKKIFVDNLYGFCEEHYVKW